MFHLRRHQIRTYTQTLIKDTEASFRNIVDCKDRHLKIQRDRLVDEFTSALTAFQAVQKKCVELEKNAVRQTKSNMGLPKPPSSNKSTSNSYPESSFEDNFLGSSRSGPTQAQLQNEIDLQALEEQENSIRELEDNIVGVNEIYKKLGALVYEQGQTIDSIEANVENASVFVQQGGEQLRSANRYAVSKFLHHQSIFNWINFLILFKQTQARKKKLILALILAGILAVILMLIFLRN